MGIIEHNDLVRSGQCTTVCTRKEHRSFISLLMDDMSPIEGKPLCECQWPGVEECAEKIQFRLGKVIPGITGIIRRIINEENQAFAAIDPANGNFAKHRWQMLVAARELLAVIVKYSAVIITICF